MFCKPRNIFTPLSLETGTATEIKHSENGCGGIHLGKSSGDELLFFVKKTRTGDGKRYMQTKFQMEQLYNAMV